MRGASIAPKTADEAAISAAMKNGGGSDLPAVTADDNGDILGVAEGAWGKVAPVSYAPYDVPFSVTIGEQTTATTTATYADVIAAHNDGKLLRADCDLGNGSNVYYPLGLVNATGGYIAFWGIVNLGTALAYITITFTDEGTVSVDTNAITS